MFKSINEKMMITKYFDSIIILRLGMKKRAKKKNDLGCWYWYIYLKIKMMVIFRCCYKITFANVPEDGVECEYFAIVSIDSLLYEKKYYLWVYLDNCAHKIIGKQMIDYLNDPLFYSD